MTGPPELGRTYRVATVRARWHGKMSAWPVIGPRHDDAEHLDFPLPHFHLDARFLSESQAAYAAERSEWRGRGDDGASLLAFAVASAPLMDFDAPCEPVERVLTCRRAASVYPLMLAREQSSFGRLYAAYAGRRCGRDAAGILICPHKGAPLGSLEPDAAGRVVCPLHGLVVDVAAERVVPVKERVVDAA